MNDNISSLEQMLLTEISVSAQLYPHVNSRAILYHLISIIVSQIRKRCAASLLVNTPRFGASNLSPRGRLSRIQGFEDSRIQGWQHYTAKPLVSTTTRLPFPICSHLDTAGWTRL